MSSLDGQLVKSAIDHSSDDVYHSSIEHIQMRRLGLPTSFGPTSRKPIKSKKRSNPKHINLDNDEAIENHDNGYDLDQQPMDIGETNRLDESDDYVDEVLTVKMSNDCYDYLDMNTIKISLENDTKRSLSETSSVNSNDNCKKIKRRKKKKKNPIRQTTYWRNRFFLFSRFSEGIKLDEESWYSVTPESIARHIANRVELALSKPQSPSDIGPKFIILDGFCGAGGNAIQFAQMVTTAIVYAVDIDPEKIMLAKHNATIYECADKIQFIVADFFQLIQSDRKPFGHVDICFLSPPWGGPNYVEYKSYSLHQMTPDGFEIARLVSKYVTKNISFLLPRNFDESELEPLSRIIYDENKNEMDKEIKVEIEKNLLYQRVKTMTAYFGNLVIDNEKIMNANELN